MVYCHGLLSQITLYWCYQHWNYGLFLDILLKYEKEFSALLTLIQRDHSLNATSEFLGLHTQQF